MTVVIKEYREVLDLAKGLIASAIAEAKDGFQVKDLVPIISENFKAAMTAYEGFGLIGAEWKENEDECIHLTVEFVIDAACDILKIGPATDAASFKETGEILAAVQGIAQSVVAHLQGGFQTAEIVPVVMENFNSIVVGVEGADKVVGEFKGDIRGFIRLVAIFAVRFAFSLKGAFKPAT